MTRTVRAVVHGRVQGVGYRAWTHHQAELRGLKGWVRNRRDGTVEAVFSGPDDVVGAMLEVCREGPRSSAVEHVETGPAETDGLSDAFEVRATV
ncbi:acylphosphatase [Microvirga flavescens]|uniref:acylphosphatase n=1 Tax=Microvirga flavescens TaxID=2249811 RepID=UPI000DD73A43|nr:acylphosphatase [Microvirga flavescens]